jgi:beta-glucosidase
MKPIAFVAGLTVVLSLAVAPGDSAAAGSGGAPAGCPWMNSRLGPDQRARLLLNASTLDQKLRWLDEQAANSPTQTTFSGVTYPVQVACTPTVVYSDGPDFVRGAAGVTVFPAQIALAASWSTKLAYAKGTAQGDEAFSAGRNVLLAPGISSSRTPLSGRLPEYLSEDPLLSGRLAAADIRGIQRGTPGRPVMAMVKHYLANEQELDRQTSSSNVDGRTLREVYDRPFQIALAEGDPGAVMCSYNQINGVYACENPILNNLLKGDGGFDGYVASDFGAVHSTGPSLTAGLDQELNRPIFLTPANINAAIDAGQVSRAQIDQAAFRVVRAYLKGGLFDHPLPATPSPTPATDAHRAVAQAEAEQGAVLLKNAGDILPLGAASSVAVIGPTASNTPTDGISAGTVCTTPFRFTPNVCPNPVAPLDAITARAGGSVTFDNGSDLTSAVNAARSASVAVVFAYERQGEFADRPNLSLEGNGDALIAAVAAANPNTVVVLETGSAVDMPWLADVKAVVAAWYPGQQQGTALARLLYGDANFTGKLPMTFPRSLADTPTPSAAQYPGVVSANIRQVPYSEGLKVGYKWYDSQNIEPLFPFGYGLSYTSFAYSGLQVSGRLHVRFTVRNTGSRTGTETPQLYLTLPASTGEPGKRLVGFDQVTLRPGQATTVEFTADPGSAQHPLSYWNTATHAWTIDPGPYGVQVGRSSRDLPLSGQVCISSC